ncbi:hypothetical protein HU200_065288 [Digitaria exilis]|uniref:Uncharacterized protein n=1 Tax=Digitaria exilis TaxID=1010633 RepID=A0A835DXL8_9POAL|nr:hypothetical protein HU200_065288 [Digitaria exilis]
MHRSSLLLLLGILHLCCLLNAEHITSGTPDVSEMWGYVQVREKAYLFWKYYKSPQRVSSPEEPWQTVLFAAPASTGRANFLGVGPLDINMKPRKNTWLRKADLIFVDSPVGTGYSYVEDESAPVTTELQEATDIVELLKILPKEIPTLQSSRLILVAGALGSWHSGKIYVDVGQAIYNGTLNLMIGGDSYIYFAFVLLRSRKKKARSSLYLPYI